MLSNREKQGAPTIGGWAGWMWKRWRAAQKPRARLELLERITLAPRQMLSLVEADGRRFLIATSVDGAPAFLALRSGEDVVRRQMRRISW